MLRRMWVCLLVWNVWVSVVAFVLAVALLRFGGEVVSLTETVDTLERRVSGHTSTLTDLQVDMSRTEAKASVLRGQVSIVAVAARSGWRHAERLIREGVFDPVVMNQGEYWWMDTTSSEMDKAAE
jgi:hypothetical protein